MRIIKNWGAASFVFVLLVAGLCGCAPKGTRAFLEAREMMEDGRFAEAVEELEMAASLMPTNAVIWNQLGLAYHHTGQFTNAEQAYVKALTSDRNLAEAHYNLGCLRFENEQFEGARSAWVVFTSLRATVPEGWLRLGTAHLKLREFPQAERCFEEVLRLEGKHLEALNSLGLLHAQRRDFRRAVSCFTDALEQKPDYAPALLNLAVLNHTQFNNRPVALQYYREYAAAAGETTEAKAARQWAGLLETELAPAAQAESGSAPGATTPAAIIGSAGQEPDTARPVRPPPTAVAESASASRSPTTSVARASVSTRTPAPVARAETPAARTNQPGFLQRINPMRVIRNRGEDEPRASDAPKPVARARVESEASPTAAGFPRYSYQNPPKPRPGDTAAGERAFQIGSRAHQTTRLTEAIQAYREATRLDPANFEAFYNLALASLSTGNLSQALTAYEHALAIRPDSLDARFNFALALKQGNYVSDAIRELETILARYPRESRVHVLLGNIYSQQLRQNAKAKEHYLTALQLDPRNPQAPNIRFWLSSH
ncbi:MAG TPA: tetratricopeptide repeat protein [Verrucomicrobiae bacterium]|nr:tetratricopeptide repeat protein [Verrucomicrobiae bacterium]